MALASDTDAVPLIDGMLRTPYEKSNQDDDGLLCCADDQLLADSNREPSSFTGTTVERSARTVAT
jgi:hypothetical protein